MPWFRVALIDQLWLVFRFFSALLLQNFSSRFIAPLLPLRNIHFKFVSDFACFSPSDLHDYLTDIFTEMLCFQRFLYGPKILYCFLASPLTNLPLVDILFYLLESIITYKWHFHLQAIWIPPSTYKNIKTLGK